MDFGVKFQGREDTGFEKNFEIRLYPDKTVVQAFGYNRISKNFSSKKNGSPRGAASFLGV